MVTYLGSLVQLCCGEGGTLQTNITGMCGECSQYLSHTGFAPTHGACAFPVYTAQASGCSAGELSKVGPGLRALPRSKLLRFQVVLQGNCLKWALGCVHFPCLSHSGSGSRVFHKGTELVGPVFCALPGSEQLRRPGAKQEHSPQVGGASYHLPYPSCSVSWVLSGSTISGVPGVSSGQLISGCDPPGRCQLFKIPGRLG